MNIHADIRCSACMRLMPCKHVPIQYAEQNLYTVDVTSNVFQLHQKMLDDELYRYDNFCSCFYPYFGIGIDAFIASRHLLFIPLNIILIDDFFELNSQDGKTDRGRIMNDLRRRTNRNVCFERKVLFKLFSIE